MTPYQYWLGQVLLLILTTLIKNMRSETAQDTLIQRVFRLDDRLNEMYKEIK